MILTVKEVLVKKNVDKLIKNKNHDIAMTNTTKVHKNNKYNTKAMERE